MNQSQLGITQQSNRVGVRFLCGDDGREAFIWGIMPDFYYFGASKKGWFFTYFGINGTLMNAWDKQTIYKPTMNALDGVCDPTWVWRVDRTNMGAFLSESWYLTYPPQNNHFGSKWSHAAQQWQKCVNTTIKWYSITVSIGGWWSLTNMAAYNIRFGCNFLGTKSYGMDRVGCE